MSDPNCSSSTSTATSRGNVNQSRKLVNFLKSQAELAYEIHTLCLRMDKLCEEIEHEFSGMQPSD